MLLDPINAITSVSFYRRVARQPGWRTAGYLAYVSLLVSLAFTAAMKIHAGPEIDAVFDWLKKSVPPMTFVNGKLTASQTEPIVLRYPQVPQIGAVIDTNRTEPVTLQALQSANVRAYLTSNAFYFDEQLPGQASRLTVYDFSKAADPKPVTIDAAFFESARRMFDRILYPAVFAAGWLFDVFWNAGWTLLFALTGLLLNALAEGGASFSALIPIALYAQTLGMFLSAIATLMGKTIPLWPAVSLVVTGVYIWLAIAKLKEPPPAA